MNSHNLQTCLGIPIPLSMRNIVRAPPPCLPARGDHETIEILEELGKAFNAPEDEITQAQNLAAGLSDILIILERPRHRWNHAFDVSFEEFVKSCKTLLAVDEVIRFATNGARSIHTVAILDAFSYQPEKELREQTKQHCHGALARILKAKKPRVVVRCHRDAYSNEWLKCIEQPGEEYKLKRKEIRITEDHTTVVLQSFHPSCAVNNADCRPEFRALLMYHFVAAFSELTSEFTLPETAEEIRKLCGDRGRRRPDDIPALKPGLAACLIAEELRAESPRSRRRYRTPSGQRMQQLSDYGALFKWLKHLFGNTKTFGGLAIAKVVLFYWKQHFHEDPLYDHILSWLILCGNEQENWVPSGPRALQEQFSSLQISSTTSTKDDIKTIKTDTVALLTEASETLGREEKLEEEFCARVVDVLGKHNELYRKYLSKSSMSDINHAMHIRNMLVFCEIFLSAVKAEASTLEKQECLLVLNKLENLEGLLDPSMQK